jgi:hypothetical protein
MCDVWRVRSTSDVDGGGGGVVDSRVDQITINRAVADHFTRICRTAQLGCGDSGNGR